MKKNIDLIVSNNIRRNILKLSHKAGSSHIGSCLSIVDLLTVIYNHLIKIRSKKNSKYELILSKGHACLALYCALYEKKILNKKTLFSYGSNKTILMQHVSHKVPGINFSTGSLGHGLPVGVGLALSSKLKNRNKKIIIIISDGELNEGTTWEALLFASHHQLDNLVVVIDYNKLQSLTSVKKTLNIEPLAQKIRAFGCKSRFIDGHNFHQIKKNLLTKNTKKPLVIVANTTKGKGISFMENKIAWHYKFPNHEELKKGLEELKNA
jgi:transketolase|tara:strand:+ start:670 stop:1467 length:798 start_codon:yes stop_codon:yes gene_type:complete